MIHNVNGIMVDINGELFPAVNLWIPVDYPNGKEQMTQVYFEMLFENGYDAVVYQENGSDDETLCERPQEHFIVEICHKDDRYQEIIFAYHCDSEDDLTQILNQEKKLNAIRDELAIDQSALADI